MRIRILPQLLILMLIPTININGNSSQAAKSLENESAQKFIEYGDIPFTQEKQHLDNLAAQLRSSPDLIGYIIVYAGRSARPNESQQHANRLYSYLFNEQDIDERQLMTIDGGFRESRSVEMFLVVRGKAEPRPSPTVRPSDVEFIDDSQLSATAIHKNVDELLALALNKVEPKYPPLARAARVTGEVGVRVIIDEEGRVVEVRTMFGHPLLRDAAERTAREWRFTPANEAGRSARVAGLLIFNFKL